MKESIIYRNVIRQGEDLNLRVLLLEDNIGGAVLHWRGLCEKKFSEIPLEHVNRVVYNCILAGGRIKGDFEYYIEAKATNRQKIQFLLTAASIYQTVIIMK